MCGINVILNNSGIGLPIDSYQTIMANATRHRGVPEAFNEKISLERCILGVNRLPITSGEGERQPASNEDGTIFAVLNGEIYNYKSLRNYLISRCHKFNTSSDTEVLVHMYEEKGRNMVQSLDGMFAFVIYDSKTGNFMAARDPTGIKPLYFASQNGVTYVSSEIKGLSKLDVAEIEYLSPGHYLTSQGVFRYFNVQPPAVRQNLDTLIENLRELIDNAVRKMVDTPLPIGVLFSGGIDSATVLSTAIKYHPKMSAITFGIKGSPDRKVAERYCKENSIPLIIAEPQNLDHITDEFVRVAETIETPIVHHIPGNYFASKLAHENGLRVVLVGESSDELFGGYSIFKEVDNNLVTKVSQMLLGNLHRTQLQRVDRGAMQWTVEARVPFLDPALFQFALGIPNHYKVFHDGNRAIEKWILRQAMTDRLPAYITSRTKEDFCTGAGLDVAEPDGTFGRIAERAVDDVTFRLYRRKFPEYDLRTKEEVRNFMIFHEEGYTKAKFNSHRIRTVREETFKRILKKDAC